MPTYGYTCQKCKKKFELKLTIGEHDKKRVRCPKCSSAAVDANVASFFATTSKKS
jgi:putative FmdB family regulatory protein